MIKKDEELYILHRVNNRLASQDYFLPFKRTSCRRKFVLDFPNFVTSLLELIFLNYVYILLQIINNFVTTM